MILGLAIAALTLTLFDALFTVRRLEKYGPAIETNPVIATLLHSGWGVTTAITLGCIAPSGLIVLGLSVFGLDHGLAFYVGVRSLLSYFQLVSLRLEPAFDERIREAAKRSPSSANDLPDR